MIQIYSEDEIDEICSYLKKLKDRREFSKTFQAKVTGVFNKVMTCRLTSDDHDLKSDDLLEARNISFKIKSIHGDNLGLDLEAEKNIPFSINEDIELKSTNTPLFLIENMLKALDEVFKPESKSLAKQFTQELIAKPPIEKTFCDLDDNRQKELVNKALSLLEQDGCYFFLGWGPPGTGKTTCIVEIIKKILERDLCNSVLVTSFTNVAVDNVLARLIDKKEKIVRLGSENSIRIKEVKQLIKPYDKQTVVGATLDTIGLERYASLEFDLAIIDESSMIEFPKALLAIKNSKKFIMFGDPKQLPPIIDNKLLEGFSEDLPHLLGIFNRLMDVGDPYFVQLDTQFRSHPDLVKFSSERFYSNNLKSPPITKGTNFYDNINKYSGMKKNKKFLSLSSLIQKIISPDHPLILINTADVENWSYNSGKCPNCNAQAESSYDNSKKNKVFSCQNCECDWKSNRTNALEIAISHSIIKELFKVLHDMGYPYYWRDLGFITPFRDQNTSFNTSLRSECFEHPRLKKYNPNYLSDIEQMEIVQYMHEIEAGTVHKYQGREKDIIIFSMSHHGGRIPKAFEHPELLNVALTRAKNKLIVIGNFDFEGFCIYNDFYNYVYHNLPESIVRLDENNIEEFTGYQKTRDIVHNFVTKNVRLRNKVKKKLPKIKKGFSKEEVEEVIIITRKFVQYERNNNHLFDIDSVNKHKDLRKEFENKDVYDYIFLEGISPSKKFEYISKKYSKESYIYQLVLKEKLISDTFDQIKRFKNCDELIKHLDTINKELIYDVITIADISNKKVDVEKLCRKQAQPEKSQDKPAIHEVIEETPIKPALDKEMKDKIMDRIIEVVKDYKRQGYIISDKAIINRTKDVLQEFDLAEGVLDLKEVIQIIRNNNI